MQICSNNWMSFVYPKVPNVILGGMIAGISLAAAVPMVILANLMYMKCVRQR